MDFPTMGQQEYAAFKSLGHFWQKRGSMWWIGEVSNMKRWNSRRFDE